MLTSTMSPYRKSISYTRQKNIPKFTDWYVENGDRLTINVRYILKNLNKNSGFLCSVYRMTVNLKNLLKTVSHP